MSEQPPGTPGSSERSPSQPPAGSDPVADRRRKLARLRDELKVDPYGQRTEGLISLAEARAQHSAAADEAVKANPADDRRAVVKVAGRIVLHRDIGKLVFLTLRDASGDLQVAVSKKSVDEKSFELAKLADLGDIVVASGPIGATKTGEITVWAAGEGSFAFATKSLVPPPEKWHGLTDPELRYRQRYVDLWANPDVMRTVQLRARIVDEVRNYFRGRGFLEVETPMLQVMHGGAAARPFVTHHNALDMRLFLRIAPELYLKRLLVGGMPKVFEINRNFRNEGISPRHNPEFTMLEAYEAFGSWETMADLVEDMICTVAQNVLGTLKIEHPNGREINLQRPWRRVRMADLVAERTGWKFEKQSLLNAPPDIVQSILLALRDKASARITAATGVDLEATQRNRSGTPAVADAWRQLSDYRQRFEPMSPAEQLVEVYEKLIEPELHNPTFVTHVPGLIIPLAKRSKDDDFFADVYELAINGVEISPGYTELNDPDVQEKHFRHQVGDREEQQQVDEDFLNALRVGMPPAGGMGLGIDRLVMMLTGAESIRDVILFPLMRPQG